jgi:peptide/nickel transport system permease protein
VLKFIFKRVFYSIFIIVGVLLLTFTLFRLAAGDPARTVLGKKPSPKEIEDLRQTLASDKPLFWGHWKKSEIFSSANFAEPHFPNGVTIAGDYKFTGESIILSNATLTFKRNFEEPDIRVKCDIIFRGSINCNGKDYYSDTWKTISIEFKNSSLIPEGVRLVNTANLPAEVKEVLFSRYQKHLFDSQLTAAFKEIVWVQNQFPYFKIFNFGRTLISREPVKQVLMRGIPASLALMLPIFFGELFLGIILALISTAYRDRWPDRIIMFLSIAGMSVSYVVMLILGQWYLGYYFNLVPVWGYLPLSQGLRSVSYLILPVSIGIISGLGGGVRFYRTIFVNELKKEYLRTAEAKGCSKYKIYFYHLLRNAAVPLITRASTVLPFLFTGSLLLESFFGIPGLGYAGINALKNSDLQMVKALVILTAILFVIMNTLSDIIYAWADPRVRR